MGMILLLGLICRFSPDALDEYTISVDTFDPDGSGGIVGTNDTAGTAGLGGTTGTNDTASTGGPRGTDRTRGTDGPLCTAGTYDHNLMAINVSTYRYKRITNFTNG